MADRKFFIDAAVVKTMKARKEIKHVDLTQEVIRLVRFPLVIEQLQDRIKQLIATDYMKRKNGEEESGP